MTVSIFLNLLPTTSTTLVYKPYSGRSDVSVVAKAKGEHTIREAVCPSVRASDFMRSTIHRAVARASSVSPVHSEMSATVLSSRKLARCDMAAGEPRTTWQGYGRAKKGSRLPRARFGLPFRRMADPFTALPLKLPLFFMYGSSPNWCIACRYLNIR